MNPSTIVKPCEEKHFQKEGIYCLYDSSIVDTFTPEIFTAHYWQHKKAISGTAQGRGTTYFIADDQKHWVLKHYFRGGLIGKIINDSYLFTGLQHTRSVSEFTLLKQLNALSLPAPRPVAVQVVKHGIFYRADIITERITNAQDLVAILLKEKIKTALWRNIGQCIRRFHNHGIYHHDLNAHNILIDDKNKIWLIDFDRGEQRSPAKTWQQANMERLLRSFEKEHQQNANFHWHSKNWQLLMEGYLAEAN
ncbi:3-deoxy-D-manno-octulosonic acid kinase [Thalassotalea sediminis]|uniref:3-deoxy-D-manno-octulosonic acid kinase n=1 Tax=Thalassotalea sediminis TaxID=1759089 RepID=UPI0025746C27|nr:3-deoxy-D-manno-octulosonic acid kinase [Thalassotalea sediminis]